MNLLENLLIKSFLMRLYDTLKMDRDELNSFAEEVLTVLEIHLSNINCQTLH